MRASIEWGTINSIAVKTFFGACPFQNQTSESHRERKKCEKAYAHAIAASYLRTAVCDKFRV
jgi:hypothetical protein